MADEQEPVVVGVLGMARSGTSLAAGVLRLLGVEFGDEAGLIPADERNEAGYWEQRQIYELNEAVLHAIGAGWGDPPGLDDSWASDPALDFLARRARVVIEELFGGARVWGFKDPRTSFTLPFWQALVPGMRHVLCVRNPAEVARSYERFFAAEPGRGENGMELWVRSTASALLATEGTERLVVWFDRFFSDRDAQVAELARFVRSPERPGLRAELDAFIGDGLRHHAATGFDGDGTPAGDAATALYEALRRDDGVEDAAREALATIGASKAVQRRLLPPPAALVVGDGSTADVRSFGLYEDGWLAPTADVMLAGGGRSALVVRCEMLPLADQRVEVSVDGQLVAARDTTQGLVSLRALLPAGAAERHVEVRFHRASPIDRRVVSARLRSLRLVPAPAKP